MQGLLDRQASPAALPWTMGRICRAGPAKLADGPAPSAGRSHA